MSKGQNGSNSHPKAGLSWPSLPIGGGGAEKKAFFARDGSAMSSLCTLSAERARESEREGERESERESDGERARASARERKREEDKEIDIERARERERGRERARERERGRERDIYHSNTAAMHPPSLRLREALSILQGYLAHEKQRPRRTLP